MNWGSLNNMMFVVGGTRPEVFGRMRKLAPEHFFLVPGIGAQGGDLKAVSSAGLTPKGGLLVNLRALLFTPMEQTASPRLLVIWPRYSEGNGGLSQPITGDLI
jgi:orotidine-5'-phosphate decarboxylase